MKRNILLLFLLASVQFLFAQRGGSTGNSGSNVSFCQDCTEIYSTLGDWNSQEQSFCEEEPEWTVGGYTNSMGVSTSFGSHFTESFSLRELELYVQLQPFDPRYHRLPPGYTNPTPPKLPEKVTIYFNFYNTDNQNGRPSIMKTDVYLNEEKDCPMGYYTLTFEEGELVIEKGTNYFMYYINPQPLQNHLSFGTATNEAGKPVLKMRGTPHSSCETLDVQLCDASQNFALGYDESVDITINNVPNAEGNLTYLWSNEGTTAGISVAPEETTTYSVTVTDANGCEGTAQHEVVVYDVAYTKSEKEDKETDDKKLAKEAEKAAKDLEKGHNEVIMTHKGDHEHKVKAKDVAKKLNDKKGEWTLGTLLMQEIDFSGGDCADEDRYKTDLQEEDAFAFEDEFRLNAYPNPVRNTLTLESETKLNGIVMIYDLFGALLDERIAHDVWKLNLDFTHLRKGFYTVVYENNEGIRIAKRILKQ